MAEPTKLNHNDTRFCLTGEAVTGWLSNLKCQNNPVDNKKEGRGEIFKFSTFTWQVQVSFTIKFINL